jgi:N6-adenosine-specific RNA methylase IME4
MQLITEGPFKGLRKHNYRVLYVDVPWKYVTWSGKGLGKSPDNHYDTMTLDEIKALPVRELLHPEGCLMHFWVIDSHVEIAMEVIKAWGFKYKTVGFYWAKVSAKQRDTYPIGTGFWTRANPEHAFETYSAENDQDMERVFLTTWRKPKRVAKDVRRLILAPRREHSRKPDEIPLEIMRLTHGPYLELFGRQSREGWTVWGKQNQLFDDPLEVAEFEDEIASVV